MADVYVLSVCPLSLFCPAVRQSYCLPSEELVRSEVISYS